MRYIDKSTAYSKLADIKQEGIDTSRYIRELAGKDVVPYDVIVFINKYKRLEQLETYNRIYENRRKNPLYKTVVNENSSNDEKALALSSILTQSFIKSKTIDEEDKTEYFKIMNTQLICDALHDYSLGYTEKLVEVFTGVRDVFKKLYGK